MSYQPPGQPIYQPPPQGYGYPAPGQPVYAPPGQPVYAPPGQPIYQPQPGYPPPQPVYYPPQPLPTGPGYTAPGYTAPGGNFEGYQPLPSVTTSGGEVQYKPPRRCCGVTCDDECKRKFAVANMVIGAIVALILLIISSVAYTHLSGFVNDYKHVVESWKEQPIIDVQVVTGTDCPNDWHDVSGWWPGVYPACDCSEKKAGTNSTSSDIYECTSRQLDDGCWTRYARLGALTLDLFPNMPFCIKRGGDPALSRKPVVNGFCPAGYQVCGSNSTGQGDYRICFPSTLSCPISDFGFTINEQISLAQAQADEMQSGFVSRGQTYYLYKKRGGRLNPNYFAASRRSSGSYEFSGLPLTDITFQNSDPCTIGGCGYSGAASEYSYQSALYRSYLDSFRPKIREGYTLKPRMCEGGCKRPDVDDSVSKYGRDLRYSQIHRILETDLLSSYSRTLIPSQFVTQNQPTWFWELSARAEITWYPYCPRDRADVASKSDQVSSVQSAQLIMLIISILSFLILSLYFPLIACRKPDFAEKHKRCNCFLKVIFKVISLVCTIVTIVIAIRMLGFWGDIAGAGDNDCSDPLTAETFNTLYVILGKLSMNNKINTASSAGGAILEFFETFIHRCI